MPSYDEWFESQRPDAEKEEEEPEVLAPAPPQPAVSEPPQAEPPAGQAGPLRIDTPFSEPPEEGERHTTPEEDAAYERSQRGVRRAEALADPEAAAARKEAYDRQEDLGVGAAKRSAARMSRLTTSPYDPEPVVDYADIESKVATKLITHRIDRFMSEEKRQPTPEERAELNNWAERQAKALVEAEQSRGTGRTFIPSTGRVAREHAKSVSRSMNAGWDAFEDAAEQAQETAATGTTGFAGQERAGALGAADLIGRYALNLLAGMYATAQITTTADRVGSDKVEMESEHALQYFGRMGTSTPIAAGVKTRSLPGSDEAIDWISKGGDITEAFPEMGAATLFPEQYWTATPGQLSWMTSTPEARQVGAFVSVPIILTEADPISLGMGSIGMGAKITGNLLDSRRIAKTQQALRKTADNVAITEMREGVRRIGLEADNVTQRALVAEVGYHQGLNSDVAAKVDAQTRKLPELQKKAADARARAEKATDARVKAEETARADSYEYEALNVEAEILARREARERIHVEQMEQVAAVTPQAGVRAAKGLEKAQADVLQAQADLTNLLGKKSVDEYATPTKDVDHARGSAADLIQSKYDADAAAMKAEAAVIKAKKARASRMERRKAEMKEITTVHARKRTVQQSRRLNALRNQQAKDKAGLMGGLPKKAAEYKAAHKRASDLEKHPFFGVVRQQEKKLASARKRHAKLLGEAPPGIARQRLNGVSKDLNTVIRQLSKLEKAGGKHGAKIEKKGATERLMAQRVITAEDRVRVAEYGKDAWRDAARRTADSLDAVRARMKAQRGDLFDDAGRFEDVTRSAVLHEGPDNRRVIDKGALWKTLEERFGKEALERHIAQGGPAGRALGRAVDSSGQRVLTTLRADEVADLQASIEPLQRLSMMQQLREEGSLRGMTLLEAWNKGGMTMGESVRRTLGRVDFMRKAFDPRNERFGDYADDVLKIGTGTTNNVGRLSDEIALIARENPEHPFDLIRYVDTHEKFKVSDGYSLMNQFDETLWVKAKRYITTAGEVNPEQVTNELLGLSRVWIKGGISVSDEASAFLVGQARTNIAKAKSFQEFLDLQRKATGSGRGVGSTAGVPLGTETPKGLIAGIREGSGTVKERVTGARTALAANKAQLRSVDHAVQLVGNAAMLDEASYMMSRAAGGVIDENTAASVNALLTGAYDKIPGSYDDALEGLLRLGQPFTRRSVRVLDEAQSTAKTLVAHSKLATGETVFMPAPLVNRFDELSSGLIRELDATYAKSQNAWIKGTGRVFAEGIRLWRTDVVLGLGVPQLKYWANNVVGDLSQMWLTEGVGTAARLTTQNLLTNVPFLGRFAHDRALEMAKWANGKPVLGDVVNAVFNPKLSDIWQGKAGSFRTKTGQVITNDQIRKWMPEDGILDTFVKGELHDAYWRAAQTAPWAKMPGAQHWINEWAAFTQQRQRGAFYVDMLRQGYTRKEATRRTMDALYDWESGLTNWELKTVARVIPFYRFWGLAMRQGIRASLEGLTKPGATMLKGMVGQTKTARARQQMLLLNNLHDFQGEDPNEVLSADQQYYELAKHLRPGYLDSFPRFMGDMSAAERDWSRHVRKRDHTHVAYTLPKPTVWDITEIQLGMVRGIAGMLASSQSDTRMLASDWEERFWDPVLSMPYGPISDGLKQIGEKMGADVGVHTRRSVSRLSEAQAAMLLSSKYTAGYVSTPDPETGEYSTDSWLVSLLSLTPVIGSRIPSLADQVYFNNPEWQNGPGRATLRMLQNMSGVMAPRTYSPRQQLDYRDKDVKAHLRDLAPPGSVDPGWEAPEP